MLAVGTKLYGPDRGFGEKHGVIVGSHPIGEYVIKWDEFEWAMTYSPDDDVEGKVREGIFQIVDESPANKIE
jgi:hypothetical protein